MVFLLSTSPVNLTNSPTLSAWEKTVRENYQTYQNKIDQITFNLQKAQRGFTVFGQCLYPVYQQRDLQNLRLYKLKQQVGKINQNEVDEYKKFNPNIASMLNQTFATHWYLPNAYDLSLIAALQVYAQVFNFQYSWRLGFLVVPYALKVFYLWGNNNSAVPTSEFLQWVIQSRTARSQIERTTINEALATQTRKLLENTQKPLLDVYQDVISLALQQQPNL